jgi:hypothetical protein
MGMASRASIAFLAMRDKAFAHRAVAPAPNARIFRVSKLRRSDAHLLINREIAYGQAATGNR